MGSDDPTADHRSKLADVVPLLVHTARLDEPATSYQLSRVRSAFLDALDHVRRTDMDSDPYGEVAGLLVTAGMLLGTGRVPVTKGDAVMLAYPRGEVAGQVWTRDPARLIERVLSALDDGDEVTATDILLGFLDEQ